MEFTRWFRKREKVNEGAPQVLLWPDTFNNYFHPPVAKAAVEVLEHAGYQVTIPERSLCCGRPLYDFGMLKTAKRLLKEALDEMSDPIQSGVPMIGLEPSCLAVFRDEMINLFPNDWNARRLYPKCFTLSQFLEKENKPGVPRLSRKALVHGHCHHKAILTMKAEERLYDRMGLDYEVLDSGCCGMAGSFGLEKEHYSISVACGERALLPAVRQAEQSTLIIADGFSCREQISQMTHRKAKHTAEILQMAINAGSEPRPANPAQRRLGWAAVAAGAVAGVAASLNRIRQANPILDRRPALDYARLAAQASGVNSAIF